MEPTIKHDKGQEGGSCNRTACQADHAAFCYNRYTYAWYCRQCARAINHGGKLAIVDIPADYNQKFREARTKFFEEK